MLERLHVLANSIILKIVFIIIILSFVLTSINTYLINGSNNNVVKVNGTKISQVQLQQAFQQEKQALAEQLGNKLSEITSNEEGVKMLRRKALERLIEITLLNQYSNELGLIATDNQIKQNIYNMPIFQKNKHFDSDKYQSILSQYNINANDFAEEIRQNLINRQLTKIYIMDEFALPEEVNNYAKLLLEKREVKIATLSITNYLSRQKVKNNELKNYYNAYKKSFILPEQVQISYIKLDAISNHKNIIVRDEELENYYKKNISNFTKPIKKHYSMIELATKEEADLVLKDLINGAEFKKLVTEKSIDKFSSKNHGEIGWMEIASTPNEIISANLTKKGQISNVIKSDTSYIIFRLDNIKPKVVRSFKSVKNEILNLLRYEKSINQFYSMQQIASRAAIDDNKSLTTVEKVTGIKAIKTGWFSRNNLPEEISFDKLGDTIFNGNLLDKNGPTGINSKIINIEGNRAFIIRVEKYKPEVMQEFDDVKRKVTELVKIKNAKKEMEIDCNKLLIALKNGISEIVLKKLGINFSNSKIIGRFGENSLLAEQIFQMKIPKENKYTYMKTKDDRDNLIIIKLIKVSQEQADEDKLNIFSKRYKIILGNVMMESLMLNLRNNAKIDLIGSIE
ncbi:MAG: peptidylprolyl isomerase [Arsenophonus sp. ER-QC15-MAG3]